MASSSLASASAADAILASPAAIPVRPASDDSPQGKMSRRFPQKVRVGDLVGRNMVADNYDVLGPITQVVRTPAGKILLIVDYSRWFGLFARPVAVPIERVGALGKQVGSIDMEAAEYRAAPTYAASQDTPIAADEIILIAIAKR